MSSPYTPFPEFTGQAKGGYKISRQQSGRGFELN